MYAEIRELKAEELGGADMITGCSVHVLPCILFRDMHCPDGQLPPTCYMHGSETSHQTGSATDIDIKEVIYHWALT